jgi:hypothetical protein
MKGLYEEDLNRAFLRLHQKDKVELMTVCKRWAKIIQKNCLMETVRISSMLQLERVYKKLIAKHGRDAQVKRLLFDFHLPKSFNVGRYIDQFPNVRVVFMHLSSVNHFPTTIRPSRNSWIERIDDGMGSALSTFFLKSYKCTRLKELYVNEYSIGLNTPDNFMNLLLRYVPYLKTIHVSLTTIPLNMFEALHQALPSLESLNLTSTKLIDADVPETVEPAKALKVLDVSFSSDKLSTQIKYLQYARKKYPNLTTLEYSSHDLEKTSAQGAKRFYKEGLIPLLKQLLPQLQCHNVKMEDIPQVVIDMLDQIKLRQKFFQLEFTKKLTINLVMKLMSKIEDDYQPQGSNIGFQNVMENREYARLYNADRLKYIKNLTLSYDDPFDLKVLKGFTSLEGLELQLNSFAYDSNLPVLDFNQLVENMPDTVEYLEVRSMPIQFEVRPNQKCRNMKRLDLIGVYCDRGIDDLIAEYFPNLSRLAFDGVRLCQAKFDLSNLNLSHLLVKRPYYLRNDGWIEKRELNVVISRYTSRRHDSRREKRIWCVDGEVGWIKDIGCSAGYSDAGVYPHVRNMPYVKGKGGPKPTLIFELGSVSNVVVNNADMKVGGASNSKWP